MVASFLFLHHVHVQICWLLLAQHQSSWGKCWLGVKNENGCVATFWQWLNQHLSNIKYASCYQSISNLFWHHKNSRLACLPTRSMYACFPTSHAYRHILQLSPNLKMIYYNNYDTVVDADGDDVRCRWAYSYLRECGGVCQNFPASLNYRDVCCCKESIDSKIIMFHFFSVYFNI